MTSPDEIVAVLRARILDLEYPVGAPLREEALSRELGASRRTVREALISLSRSGLVDHVPNRGGRVRRFTAADIADLYQARRAWEAFGAAQAGGAEQGALAAVGEAFAALEQVVRTRADTAEHAERDMAFHRTVAALAGSPRLDRAFAVLTEEMLLAIRILQRAETESALDVEEDLAQHRAIAEAVARRDAASAVAAVEEHIRTNRARLLAIADQPVAPPS
ncbi:MAG: GntR family transcriptional regulator [Quadrisphaera sp.]